VVLVSLVSPDSMLWRVLQQLWSSRYCSTMMVFGCPCCVSFGGLSDLCLIRPCNSGTMKTRRAAARYHSLAATPHLLPEPPAAAAVMPRPWNAALMTRREWPAGTTWLADLDQASERPVAAVSGGGGVCVTVCVGGGVLLVLWILYIMSFRSVSVVSERCQVHMIQASAMYFFCLALLYLLGGHGCEWASAPLAVTEGPLDARQLAMRL
jgi:hypothetical protein